MIGKRWIVVLAVVLILSFGGLFFPQAYRYKALKVLVDEARIELGKRGEIPKEICAVDFSPFVVEFGLRTEQSSYYVMGGITDPWWIEATVFKYLIKPDAQIIEMIHQGYTDEDCMVVSASLFK